MRFVYRSDEEESGMVVEAWLYVCFFAVRERTAQQRCVVERSTVVTAGESVGLSLSTVLQTGVYFFVFVCTTRVSRAIPPAFFPPIPPMDVSERTGYHRSSFDFLLSRASRDVLCGV